MIYESTRDAIARAMIDAGADPQRAVFALVTAAANDVVAQRYQFEAMAAAIARVCADDVAEAAHDEQANDEPHARDFALAAA